MKQATVPSQLTRHIDELENAARDHGEKLATLTKNLTQASRSFSRELLETRDAISQMNQASQQQGGDRTTDTLMRMDRIRAELVTALDSMMGILQDRRYLEDQRIRVLEASLTRLEETAAIVQGVREEVKNITQAEIGSGWLKQISRQLVSSGITSAMTGAFVFMATKSGLSGPSTSTSR